MKKSHLQIDRPWQTLPNSVAAVLAAAAKRTAVVGSKPNDEQRLVAAGVVTGSRATKEAILCADFRRLPTSPVLVGVFIIAQSYVLRDLMP